MDPSSFQTHQSSPPPIPPPAPAPVPVTAPPSYPLPTIPLPPATWPVLSEPPAAHQLLAQFPSYTIRSYLLTNFFDYSSFHWLWPIIHRPVFDGCYMAFSQGTHPQSLDFIALLAIVCASSLQFLPETPQDATTFASYPYGRHVLQTKLFEMARTLLLAPHHPTFPSIERIQASLLLAVYAENESNLVDSYNATGYAIRMAQSLAMNRDAQKVWRMKPYEAEQRRRFWWLLFVLDRQQSASLRRPYMIHEQHCDVEIPMNLDQVRLSDGPELTGFPMTQPTEQLYHIEQIKWARFMGKMWDQCFGVELPTYRTIINLEEEIRKYEAEIPVPINARVPQTVESPLNIAFQRQIMTLQIAHLRVILMRPFLFALPEPQGGLPEKHRERLSAFSRHARTVCLYYCKQLLSLSHLMQKQVTSAHLRWANMTLRVFDAAMTLAVAVVMDPSPQTGKGLEVWIVLAREIIRAMGTNNTIAQNALQGVDAICKRIETILGQRQPMPSLADDSSAHNDQNLASVHPQPSLSDLLGKEEVENPIWDDIEATVFAGNLPGLEALCAPMLAHAMDDFLIGLGRGM
ncbi:hypothetical protein K474DRAFT_1129188 [Panus rudis PR-1116 ss-1]|nr:hypothetical protein K474DRAFT_1129188 [Panus rudis PR-1116 ss-1]